MATFICASRLCAIIERDFQHLVDPAHRDDLDLALHVLGDVLQILDVVLGDHHRGDAAAVRRQELFLQAADGRDLATSGRQGLDRRWRPWLAGA